MPLSIVQGDLAAFRADALVNAANVHLKEGGGVCGALFEGAGRAAMQAACDAIGMCAPGQAVITPAFHLPARAVIHAVGPIYQGGQQGEEAVLRSAYANALRLAVENGLSSIAFPLISAGIYGYPRDQALRVATDSIRRFLAEAPVDLDVTLVLYDRQDVRLNAGLRAQIERLIRESGPGRVDELSRNIESMRSQRANQGKAPAPEDALQKDEVAFSLPPLPKARAPRHAPGGASLADLIRQADESFSTSLLRLIDSKGLTDVQVYNRANLDRKHFSKIRSRKDYRPTKPTALALAIALELDREETQSLLAKAGLALSPASTGDIIVGYFIDHRQYNIDDINAALFAYDQTLLGAVN